MFFYLIPTTFIFHNFWAQTGHEHINQMTHFLKNMAIMGHYNHAVELRPEIAQKAVKRIVGAKGKAALLRELADVV